MRKRIVFPVMAGAMVLCGCRGAAVKEVERAYEVVQLDDAARRMAFEMLRPEEKLSDWERQVILAFQVKRLAGPGWKEAHQTLVAMGKDSIPVLIAALDRTDPCHHEIKPRFGPEAFLPKKVFTLGEMAYEVLVDIVAHYSNYSGPIPPRDRARWERWWASNRSGLDVLGRGRALTGR